MDADSDRQDEEGLRPVEGVSCRDLTTSGLQEIGLRRVSARDVRRRLDDREDRADRQRHIDVARPVDRVEHHQVLAQRVAVRDRVDGVHLLGGHRGEVAAPLVGLEQDLVRHHVQPLLRFALDVDRARIAQKAVRPRLVDGVADALARPRHDLDQQPQLRRERGLLTLLLDEELREALSRHDRLLA